MAVIEYAADGFLLPNAHILYLCLVCEHPFKAVCEVVKRQLSSLVCLNYRSCYCHC